MRVEFTVPGPPRTWSRPGARVAGRGGGKRWIEWFTDADMDEYQRVVALAFGKACDGEKFVGPTRLQVLVVEPRTTNLFRLKDPQGFVWSQSQKDADNYLKMIGDAVQRCTTCGNSRKGKRPCCPSETWSLYDDKQIAWTSAMKVKSEIRSRRLKTAEPARLVVRISSLLAWSDHWLAEWPVDDDTEPTDGHLQGSFLDL